jgi:hypothetical protein
MTRRSTQRMISVTGSWFHLALENLWVRVAFHLQNSN